MPAEKTARDSVASEAQRPDARALRRPRERRLDPELGLSAFLLVLGLGVLLSAAAIAPDTAGRGPIGPRAVPVFLGIGLCLIAVAHAVDVLRGGHGEAEAGEDIELSTPPDWRTVGVLVSAFVTNILLLDVIGWPLSGALMFWLAARALGSTHPVRDVGLALALGVASYELFARFLELPLPAGPLAGVL
jgi:putative tricarboxylic transport membrane protein